MLRPILRLEKENLVNLVFMLKEFTISTNINSTFSKISNLSLGERDVTCQQTTFKWGFFTVTFV